MPKQFNTERDFAEGTAVEGAPIVGGEFVIPDAKEGELGQGQTVQVQSDKHLEDDLGVGEVTVLRNFVFAVNPESFANHTPTSQEVFDSQKRGISAMLWQDGLVPREDVEPRVMLSPSKTKFIITVAAIPQLGQTVLETTQTLSQIANGTSSNTNELHGIV